MLSCDEIIGRIAEMNNELDKLTKEKVINANDTETPEDQRKIISGLIDTQIVFISGQKKALMDVLGMEQPGTVTRS